MDPRLTRASDDEFVGPLPSDGAGSAGPLIELDGFLPGLAMPDRRPKGKKGGKGGDPGDGNGGLPEGIPPPPENAPPPITEVQMYWPPMGGERTFGVTTHDETNDASDDPWDELEMEQGGGSTSGGGTTSNGTAGNDVTSTTGSDPTDNEPDDNGDDTPCEPNDPSGDDVDDPFDN